MFQDISKAYDSEAMPANNTDLADCCEKTYKELYSVSF